jgi:hypothetical protein
MRRLLKVDTGATDETYNRPLARVGLRAVIPIKDLPQN